MGIKFLNGGILTTIQDYGRTGYQRFGFHASGAMDKHAYAIANALVDNMNNEAVVEFAIMGPQIEFTSDSVIAITGADFAPSINDEPIEMYRAVSVHKDDVLKFGFAKEGVWGYVSFHGGIDVPLVMGSRSTDIKSQLGGLEGRKILTGDEIGLFKETSSLPNMKRRFSQKPSYKQDQTKIRVVLGPQDDYFTDAAIEDFLSQEYTVSSECDRMGYKVNGEKPLEHNEKGADIISDGIAYGSIQVPKQGQLIVLLADRQTTGGYTKIATLIGADIPLFVQRKPGEKVVFEAVSPQEAQKLYLEADKEVNEVYLKSKSLLKRLLGK